MADAYELNLRAKNVDLYTKDNTWLSIRWIFWRDQEKTTKLDFNGWSGFHASIDDADGEPVSFTNVDTANITDAILLVEFEPVTRKLLPATSNWRVGAQDPNGHPQLFISGVHYREED